MAIGNFVSTLATLCVFISGSFAAQDAKPGAPPAEPKELCKQGRAQYASGDVVRAVKTLTHCVELEPRNREAWTALANAELEAGRFTQSADAFARAEALKAGDEAFLNAYLSALEGAGRQAEQIPVLRRLATLKTANRSSAERLLAAVEASGPDRHPDEYLLALQILGDGPRADRFYVEKLAGAYLRRGDFDKAEAEYRGLLEKAPESPEGWAGLGSALARTDPQAAAECYRKAALYSSQAGQRASYLAEQERLAKAGPLSKPAIPQDAKEAALATLAQGKTATPAVAEKAVAPGPSAAQDERKTKTAPAQTVRPIAENAPAKAVPAMDLKAFQDSVYRAELAKRLAALHLKKAEVAAVVASPAPAPATAMAPSATPPAPVAAEVIAHNRAQAEKDRQAQEDQRKQEESRKRIEADKIAKAELAKQAADKARQDSLARVEKARSDSLHAIADRKSKEDKARQEAVAKAEKGRQDSLARADKARQDSLKQVAARNAQEEKARQETMAKAAAKARQDSLAKVAEMKAKADKARQDSLVRVAEANAKAVKAKQDSLARVAEANAKAAKARQDSLARVAEANAKAEKVKQDSLAKVAEAKSKADKARQDSLARVAEAKVKAEKAKQDSLARIAEAKVKAEKAKQDSLARVAEAKVKAEKAKQDSLARVAEAKAKSEKVRQDSLARVEKARQERERLARERKDRFDRAYSFYRAGRLDSASVLFKTVLADSPVADAWYYAGRVHLAQGDFPRALDLFAHSPADKPDLEGMKGRALLGMGKAKEALKPLEAQYAKDKNDSLLEDIIAAKRRMGDEAGAIATLETLASRRPGVLKIQAELAAYWKSKGDRAKATERYDRVFTLDPKDGEANYWLGLQAAQAGDYPHAVGWLERAVAAYPDRADAWKSLAKAELALGRKDAAWDTHRKALALMPNDPDLAKGRLQLARESHPNELIHAYEEVLRLSPGDTAAAMGLARLRYGRGDFAGAEKDFRIALKDSKDGQAWAEFGRALLELKKSDEAAVALQKAVDLGEKDPSLRLDLARIHMDKGDLDWAEALVKDLAKQSPRDAEAQYWLGQIALKRQQTQVAEEFFRKAHQLQPDHAKYAEALAQSLRDRDEFKSALAVLSQAEPSLSPAGKLLFGDCLARAGEPSKALEVYTAAYAKRPSAPLLARRIDLLVLTGKSAQAVESVGPSPFAKAPEVRFSLAKAQLDLAESHVLKGDVDQAVDLMKQVLNTDEHNPEYHYYLGLGYYDQGRWKKALGEFGDALGYRVDYPEALNRKGICLLKLGETHEAGNAFTELSQHAEPQWKARGLYGLALVFEADGKTEAVQHHLELSIASAPMPDAMAALARVLLKQGKSAEAREWAHRALALDPGHEAATVVLADALASAKQQDQALELARAGLKVKPLSCGLLVQSAKLNFEAGRIDSSIVASNVAMKTCPEEPMAYYYAGVATRSGKRPKEAKQYFKTYRKLGGDDRLVPQD